MANRPIGVSIVLVVALVAGVAVAKERQDCGPRSDQRFESATSISGSGSVRMSADGTFTLALDESANNGSTKLYRIYSESFATRFQRLRAKPTSRESSFQEVIVLDRSAGAYRELEFVFPNAPELDMTFHIDEHRCTPPSSDIIESNAETGIFSAEAVSVMEIASSLNSLQALNAIDVVPVAIFQSPAESTQTLWCMSGGPGASSCEVNMGAIGPFDFFNCSVSCVPPAYACCGMGLGSYCTCRFPEPPSIGDPGGGNQDGGDDPGGGGNNPGSGDDPGGGGLPPIMPGPGDDDDEEPPPGEDESNEQGGRDGNN